jgi:cytoplasmic iron level regulating protein YaaA (DUF328/UPF0246 family)
MLILLSPAKTLDMQPVASSACTSAGCADAADELVGELQKLSVSQLKALLGVSDAIARCASRMKAHPAGRGAWRIAQDGRPRLRTALHAG